MRKLALLLGVVLLILAASAHADVSKGDRGEEVRYLQWLLIETGWLDGSADGVFGPHTEQALMDYQESTGAEPTGIADIDLMQALDEERVRLGKELHGQDYYEPYHGDYIPPFETNYTSPSHCMTTVLRDIVCRDSCERHRALLEQEYSLTAQDTTTGSTEAAALWLQDIGAMYAEWADRVPGGRRQDVLDTWDAWNGCFALQYDALNAALESPAEAGRQNLIAVKNYAVALCEILSGDLPAIPDMDYLDPAAASSASCTQWSLNAGTEFVTGCATHAALFDREYEWTYAGADAADGLDSISDAWDEALVSLYDRLVERCPHATELLRDAQQHFGTALTLQGELLDADGLATLARVRVVQMECARLCELLNASPAD